MVVDEVGQYVARDIQKMLDLQAIVQQLGVKGRGKVWVMVTSQEQLSDVVGYLDDNRTELARLQDRFPYKPVLEPSDIAEVTSRRVLGKNSTGEQTLQGLFQQHQGRLATHTKLDTKIRLPELTGKAFADLYPLLPYQIELIIQVVSGLRLSGGASKQFGGANRAIIKLAQDSSPIPKRLADEGRGARHARSGLRPAEQQHRLAISRQDQRHRRQGQPRSGGARSQGHLPAAVRRSSARHRAQHRRGASPRVDGDSLESEVQEACRHLEERNLIRKADGQYRIPKPEEEDWEQVRSQQAPSAQDRHTLLQEALCQNWDPVPSASLGNGVKSFKAALHFRGSEVVKGDVPVKVERVDSSESFEDRVEQLRQLSQQTPTPSSGPCARARSWIVPGRVVPLQKVIDLKGRDASGKGQVQLVSEERRKPEATGRGLPPGGSSPRSRATALERWAMQHGC